MTVPAVFFFFFLYFFSSFLPKKCLPYRYLAYVTTYQPSWGKRRVVTKKYLVNRMLYYNYFGLSDVLLKEIRQNLKIELAIQKLVLRVIKAIINLFAS